MEQGAFRFQQNQQDVSSEVIGRCRDLRAALRLCVETSGLPLKEVAFALDLQENHLSRMISTDGDRHFPPEKIEQLMEVCGNEIPLRWQALRRNYGLYRLKTALEQENERLKAELAEQQKEMQMMVKIVREIRA